MQNPMVVKDVVRQAIKEETLRAYLWTFSSYYESMSQEYLQEMFELSQTAACSWAMHSCGATSVMSPPSKQAKKYIM